MDYDIRILIMNQYNSELLISENFSDYIFLSFFKDFKIIDLSLSEYLTFPLHFR